MRRQLVAAVLLGAMVGAAANGAQARVCAGGDAQMALTTRVLQTELMVAALSCRQHDQYATFVRRFQPDLVASADALRSFYGQHYGARATKKIDALVTRLANEASQRSIDAGAAFCREARSLFDVVLDLERGQLALYALYRPHAASHGVVDCSGDDVLLVDAADGRAADER